MNVLTSLSCMTKKYDVEFKKQILDLYDRCVVASVNSNYMNTELAIDTLKRAINNEKPDAGLILHSD